MLNSIAESPLYRLVNPGHIAIFGASTNFSMGTVILSSLRNIGFEGPIYPVHPRAEEILGYRVYRSVADLPQVPDLAVLVLPNHAVGPTLEECGLKGIKTAVIVSGGFKEVNSQGRNLETQLFEIASRYDLRLVGPNCLGITNPHHKLNTTTFPYTARPGYIGMVSQSGSFVTQLFSYVAKMGLGFSTAFSVGNEVDIDVVDCLEYLGACPHTRVIALYLEGIGRGRDFVEVARSIVPRKPIVAYYGGGTETGRRAGFSHTGSMAGPDRLYDGIFRQSGIVRAYSIAELFDSCWALGSLPQPQTNRVVIQTDSGGPGAAAADACGRAGLVLPDLSPETKARLAELVPATGSLNNPVDLTFYKNPGDYSGGIPQVLLEDPNTDILMIYLLMPREVLSVAMEYMGMSEEQAEAEALKMLNGQADAIAALTRSQSKPVVGFTWRSWDDQAIRRLIDQGAVVYPEAERAAKSIRAACSYKRLREKLLIPVQN
jgi:acyl-CoA synthetase (NDP forming)